MNNWVLIIVLFSPHHGGPVSDRPTVIEGFTKAGCEAAAADFKPRGTVRAKCIEKK